MGTKPFQQLWLSRSACRAKSCPSIQAASCARTDRSPGMSARVAYIVDCALPMANSRRCERRPLIACRFRETPCNSQLFPHRVSPHLPFNSCWAMHSPTFPLHERRFDPVRLASSVVNHGIVLLTCAQRVSTRALQLASASCVRH